MVHTRKKSIGPGDHNEPINTKGSAQKIPHTGTPVRSTSQRTPAAKRLAGDPITLTDSPSQAMTPTRRSRRLSTDVTKDLPQLDSPSRVMTPTRRSRRVDVPPVDTPASGAKSVSPDRPPDKALKRKSAMVEGHSSPDVDTQTRPTRTLATQRSRRSSRGSADDPVVLLQRLPCVTSSRSPRRSGGTVLVDLDAEDVAVSEPQTKTPGRGGRPRKTASDSEPQTKTPSRGGRPRKTGASKSDADVLTSEPQTRTLDRGRPKKRSLGDDADVLTSEPQTKSPGRGTKRTSRGDTVCQDTPVLQTPNATRRTRGSRGDGQDTPITSSVRRRSSRRSVIGSETEPPQTPSTAETEDKVEEILPKEDTKQVTPPVSKQEANKKRDTGTDRPTAVAVTTVSSENTTESSQSESEINESSVESESQSTTEIYEHTEEDDSEDEESEALMIDEESSESEYKPLPVIEEMDETADISVEEISSSKECESSPDGPVSKTTDTLARKTSRSKSPKTKIPVAGQESAESCEVTDDEDFILKLVDDNADENNDVCTSLSSSSEISSQVVADETVSTTVTTDEDSVAVSEVRTLDNLVITLDESSDNAESSDQEVTSNLISSLDESTDKAKGNERKVKSNLKSTLDESTGKAASNDREVTSTTVVPDVEDTPVDCEPQTDEVKVNNNDIEKADIKLALPKSVEPTKDVTRGARISGRFWKKEKERFRSILKDATGKKSWRKKMIIKQERQAVLARSAAIEADRQKRKEVLKERRRINKIRQEENAKRSEIVQIIKDPRKLKKLKRKQMKYIQTRDTTSAVQGR